MSNPTSVVGTESSGGPTEYHQPQHETGAQPVRVCGSDFAAKAMAEEHAAVQEAGRPGQERGTALCRDSSVQGPKYWYNADFLFLQRKLFELSSPDLRFELSGTAFNVRHAFLVTVAPPIPLCCSCPLVWSPQSGLGQDCLHDPGPDCGDQTKK